MKLTLTTLLALTISTFAAEPPPLINTVGEHTLATGLRLIVEDKGNQPLRWTVARTYPDRTSSASGHSPLADPGQPFVFCWDSSTKRLWVASHLVVGYVNFIRMPTETPKDFSDHGNLIHESSVPAALVAEMPANFRTAASPWIRVATTQ